MEDYTILSGKTLSELETKVDAMLDNGYVLIGGICALKKEGQNIVDRNEHCYFQAMAKPK